jgi:hypothetical protein
MLQAANDCPGGHFGPDEEYGYWVQDFHLVLNGPHPGSTFEALFHRPQLMAQLYGLVGLSLTARDRFRRTSQIYMPSDTNLLVAEACAISERSLRSVMAEIREGRWGRRLTRRRVDAH